MNLRDFWDKVIPRHRHLRKALGEKAQWIADLTDTHIIQQLPQPIGLTLDWGCGGGVPALQYARAGAALVLVDVCVDSLTHATQLLKREGYAPEATLETDKNGYLQLSELQAYVPLQTIVCTSVIHHFPSEAYAQSIFQLWLQLKPAQIAISFKPSKKTQATKHYSQNYTTALKFEPRDLIRRFEPAYRPVYQKQIKSKLRGEPWYFLVLERTDA